MRARPRLPGYTLLEVLLVMAILVILMAVAYPTMEALYGDTRVRGAADDVRGAWAEARARAIETGGGYRFAVMKGTNRFRVAPEAPEYWDGTKGSASGDEDDGQTLTGSLPKGILFKIGEGGETAGDWHVVATFLPDGTCKDDARVELEEDGSPNALVVEVRALTGTVTVHQKKQEGK
jgi:prepilin-type N-terminal cleavage/methylation domain-containing protein